MEVKTKKTTGRITRVRKRDGRIVPFDRTRIVEAIWKAAQAVGGKDRERAEELADVVVLWLEKHFSGKIPHIEDIQDTVEKVLIETGHARTAKAYILYRKERERIRKSLKIRKEGRPKITTTDLALLVSAPAQDQISSWDKRKIVQALVKEAGVSLKLAEEIAREVEAKIFTSEEKIVSTSLIRELVDNELFKRGFRKKLEQQRSLVLPIYDVEEILLNKSQENSNISSNTPEAVNLTIAETLLKQYALRRVFTQEVANAHLLGMIHIHDLGYPARVYCSSHSLEYLKKYGLELENLDTSSSPAKHARTLTGHLNTFLASMQAYYAGALGVGFINIFYAPYLVGMSYSELKQEAQYLIFSASQNAFSRGSQTLFLDFNLHTGVPPYLAWVPAIGPGGKYTQKTYGDYRKEVVEFARAMLEVWREGDRYGHPFAFPKCDLHINENSFSNPEEREILKYACEIASENGAPYFVFDRDEVTLSACCRLRTSIKDEWLIQHPESMRFCGFQNVTVNLPQAAYRAGKGNLERIYTEIDYGMEMAMKAHLQKKEFIRRLMKPGGPLWQVGKIARDGRPYIELEKCTYIIGIIGLNECVKFLTGKELHEDEGVYKLGLKLISFMNLKARELSKKHNLKVALEESPAESATRRLSRVDLNYYPEETREVVKGDVERGEYYYTNSIHFAADTPISFLERIVKQSKFHPLIESGAIIHAFVGERRPSPWSIFNLVEKVWRKTQCAQLTISPEFTICRSCHKLTRGLKSFCPSCGSEEVEKMTRIVGYFSRLSNWNPSKLGELKDRWRGNYFFKEEEKWL